MSIQAKSVKIALSPQLPHAQNLESINRIVKDILGRAGCPTCGRIAFMEVQFQGDPGPDLAKEGVTSMETFGF